MNISGSRKLLLLPFIYYYSLSLAIIISGVYLIAKIPPGGTIRLSFAQSENIGYVSSDPKVLLSSEEEFKTNVVQDLETGNIKCDEKLAAKIDTFFIQGNAPLAGYGCDFVFNANENSIDPFLVASIGWCESNGGKITPKFQNKESYNAWGWAVLDSNDNTRGLNAYGCDSWSHCIGRVSRGIGRKANLGTEPRDIVQWYTPASVEKGNGNPDEAPWTKCVVSTMKKISAL